MLFRSTLIQVGRQEHLELLRPLLTDEEPRVRSAAAEAIHTIETRYKGVVTPPIETEGPESSEEL